MPILVSDFFCLFAFDDYYKRVSSSASSQLLLLLPSEGSGVGNDHTAYLAVATYGLAEAA
jgi:hypothetical protein